MKIVSAQRLKLIAADFISSAVGFAIFDVVRFFTIPARMRPDNLADFLFWPPLVAEQLLVPLLMVALFALMGSYNRANTLYKSRLDESLITVAVALTATLVIFFIALINDNIPERATNYELIITLFLALLVPCYFTRMVVLTAAAHRVRRGDYSIDTAVVGADAASERKVRRLLRSDGRSGLRVKMIIDTDGSIPSDTFAGLPVVRGTDAADLCRRHGIGAVAVFPSSKGVTHTAALIEKLYPLGMPLFVSPDIHGLMGVRPRVSAVSNEPLIDITASRISPTAVNFKRLGDIVVSAAALLVLSPVLAGIAIAVRLDSKGPALFRQERIGRFKKPFKINKFRTMRIDAEANGPALACDDDPRVTRLGRTLRKYRLDELPQFWNVLIGEMSLVGPRPERDYYVRRLVEARPAYSLVHQVRPGITSWGMVKYGYASTVDQMLERLDYDLLYLENISLAVDLKILFYTVNTVVTGRGL